ncbi:MAG TPA: flagellar assembly protein T N-terminal domain-containing protein [Myxococcaceae bacterium]|nr:flagellar assembly protein T N-terminal domain-containing protein [Myxococcaceae bacterium]
MRTLKLSAVLLLALCSVAHAAETQPATVTKEAVGEAAIGADGNKIRARDEAKKQALRNAVEQVTGMMISSDTLTSNSQLISDRIYSNSAGYVRSHEVLSEKEDAGVMRVTVRAEVGTAELDRDLQAVQGLIKRFGSPKLVLLTQEQAIDQNGIATSSGVMATVLTESFKKDGWTIIDPAFAAGKLKLSSGVGVGGPEAKEIGHLTKADYILYGNVNFRYQPPGMMMVGAEVFIVTGEYEFTAFSTDSGSQITKISGKFKTDFEALRKNKGSAVLSYERTAHDVSIIEGGKVVADMRARVLEFLRNAEQNGSRMVLNVSGIPDFGAAQNFKRMLEERSGVRNVERKDFTGGKAQYELLFMGNSGDLAELLDQQKFKGQKLSVTGVTNTTVELSLGK